MNDMARQDIRAARPAPASLGRRFGTPPGGMGSCNRMRVGLISDVHGNLLALDAVLADLDAERLDRVVCLGDVCFGPQAHECLERIRGLGCPIVLGNWDSWSIEGFPPADDPVGIMLYEIGAFWARQLTSDDQAFVRTFVPTLEVPLDRRTKMLCFHGSPHSFSDWIFATTPDEELEPLFAGTEAQVLVGGHTHLQLLRRFGRQLVVNPGSIGQPFSQWWPRPIRVAHWAEYGIVEFDGGHLKVDLRRVPYDVDALLEIFADSAMPHAHWWIESWNAD
jgi:putative phosphoesterase